MLQCDRRAKGEAHVSQDKFGVEDQAARQTRDPSHRAGLARFVMHAFVREKKPKAIIHLLEIEKRAGLGTGLAAVGRPAMPELHCTCMTVH